MIAAAAIAAMARRQIDDARKRAGVESLFAGVRAIEAQLVPRLFRVVSVRHGRLRWRYGIDRTYAARLYAASIIHASIATRRP